MTIPRCPQCDNPLTGEEAGAGRCPGCSHKFIPIKIASRSRTDLGMRPGGFGFHIGGEGEVRNRFSPSAVLPARRPSFGKAFLFLLPFAVVGITIALVLNGGRAEGASWGAGAGVILGLVAGQALGFFPARK